MISYLSNKNRIIPSGSISLEDLYGQLLNPDFKPFSDSIPIIRKLRETDDEDEQKRLKGLLPVIVPSAEIRSRTETLHHTEKIIQYSGFIQVDIDPADNPGMIDAEIARDWLADNIPFIALAAISARGTGIWGLVAIEEPEKFHLYCDLISNYFSQAGITIDKTKSKNPLELRFFAPDPDAILKLDYELFKLPKIVHFPFPTVRTQNHAVKSQRNRIGSLSGETECMDWVTRTTGLRLVDGQKHDFIFWLCYALYKNGQSESEIEKHIYTLVPQSQIKSNCISGGIAHAKLKGN